MKKLLAIIVLGLLLGCSENEPKKKVDYKSKYNVVDVAKFENLELNIRPIAILSLSYSRVIAEQDICDIFEETLSDKNKKLLDEMNLNYSKDCGFYRKLYEAVIPNFKTINLTNLNSYYYFEYRDDSENSFGKTIGIFSNINNCNKFKNDFLDGEIGFTSNCKNIGSIN
jgi:hypothetical protein